MIVYISIYILVWILALLGLHGDFKREKLVYNVQVAILFAFSTFKFETGYDWPVYKNHYEEWSSLDFGFGFSLAEDAFKYAGLTFDVFWASIAGFIVMSMGWLVSKLAGQNRSIVIAIFFSIADLFLIPVFSIVRQTIAVLLVLTAFVLTKEKRVIWSLLLVFIAALTHLSVLPMIGIVGVCWVFMRSPILRLIFFSIFSLLYLAQLDLFRSLVEFGVSVVYPPYFLYLERDTYSASLLYRFMYVGISSALFYAVSFSIFLKTDNSNYQWGAHVAAISGLLVPFALYSFPTFASRFLFFTAFFLVPVVVALLRFRYPRYFQLSVSIVAVVMFFSFYRFLSSPFSVPFVPYQSIFFTDEKSSTGLERTQELLELIFSYW